MQFATIALLSLLAGTPTEYGPPDEYGPFLYWEQAAYLGPRLVVFSKEELALQPDLVLSPEDLDIKVCTQLFGDCSVGTEFERHHAMEAHREALAKAKASAQPLKTVVLAGFIHFGTYDFKKKSFPLSGLWFASPASPLVGWEGTPHEGASYPKPFCPVVLPKAPEFELKMPPDQAEQIRQKRGEFNPMNFTIRAEVVLPSKPVKARTGREPFTECPPIPVVLKRLRVLADSGETLAVLR